MRIPTDDEISAIRARYLGAPTIQGSPQHHVSILVAEIDRMRTMCSCGCAPAQEEEKREGDHG